MEPPGTAPGSDPLITCAFMPIARANPNRRNIGAAQRTRKGADVRETGPTAAAYLTGRYYHIGRNTCR
ncbi:hypothetical protein GCM10017635_12830 [Paracoccus kondratievae]|uniref:Uncharacterized protein n=1 Tax=Paracoccus kondratievae TaxID=135740 RepID=A0AAD3RTF5_9RHOB|nr:hypothetical protein GCM10017635_12830 [Paracoccus kondratievae]